jgi:hypothetical protein
VSRPERFDEQYDETVETEVSPLASPIKVRFSLHTTLMLDLYRSKRGVISREAAVRKLVEDGLSLENKS